MAQQFNYQGAEGPVMSKPQGSEPVTTLLIRHLPDGIPHDTLSRLLSHYGASDARPCSTARLKNCAFVDFKTEALAFQAQRQLNGLRFLGKVLSVERANSPSKDEKSQQPGSQLRKDVLNAATVKSENEGLRSGSANVSEPIAPKLGIDYPFPPHLEYAYPPPDGNILTNIVNALIAVPKFYTQVLHLMNKMNLPAPFRMALPTPPLPPSVPAPQPPPPPAPIPSKPVSADQSSSESEMESSDEDKNSKELKTPGRKRARHEAIVGPAFDKSVAHEAVGVKLGTLVPKEIPLIKKRNPVLQIKIAPKVIQDENINNNDNEQNTEEPSKNSTDPRPFASPEELEKGKLPPEEILSLPMFKNYSAGNPAPVLYIKNLAKDVVPEDFYFIFGSLFGSFDEAKSGLHVKLMQEGRMRGQAFVTFPSVDFAHRALNLANGYVFKGKPIIIQFGRNPATAKGD